MGWPAGPVCLGLTRTPSAGREGPENREFTPNAGSFANLCLHHLLLRF